MAGAGTRHAARSGRRVAREAADSPVVDALGRAGFWARGFLWLCIAAIIVATLAGRSHAQTDQRGAVAALASSGPGAILVALCAAAFAGHALWRWAEAVGGLRDSSGLAGAARRAWFAAVGVAYAALCASCVSTLFSRSGDSEDARAHEFASTMFGFRVGRPLLGATGVVLVACGIALAVWTLSVRFEDRLDVDRMSTPVRRLLRCAELPGQLARVALMVLAGTLLVRSAVDSDPGQAQGLDGTVRTLAEQALGSALLGAVAAGLICFAIASCFEAAYIRTSGDGRRRPAGR